ncbi:MAG TPA: NAD-dependent epimerase/dehydratase family protein [Planctomycetota bacterium]|nr:NAD-dependent epimerase/dehydratase family protein [Planctomycetota bacterium]
MKIFITGASGFIGSAVAEAFARNGHEVWGLVRTAAKARALAEREIEPIVGSMDDSSLFLERAGLCDVLVHCAAEYSARTMELDKRVIDELTTTATRAQAPRLFLYTSGVWIYGNRGEERVTEASPIQPPRIAAIRAEHERLVLAADRGALRTMVIRPGCVYGGSGSLTSYWFESAMKQGAALVVGDGANRWAMVHREDLAELYLRAAESSHRAEIFNAVDRSRFTQLECARAASHAAGAGGKVTHMSEVESQAAYRAMAECLAFDQHVDASKAVRMLGWQPRHGGFVDGVARYFTAWKASQGR